VPDGILDLPAIDNLGIYSWDYLRRLCPCGLDG
jgi:DUF971 family protein